MSPAFLRGLAATAAVIDFPLLPTAGASLARLRFRAAIKSIKGAGVETSRGLMATPFILASITSRNASW